MPPPTNQRRRGVVAVIVRERRLLVIRRSRFVTAPGAHCFPGGGIESGETEAEAVVRELNEELNLAGTAVRRLWQSTTERGVHLAWWHVTISPSAVPVPNPEEVDACDWYSLAEIRVLPHLLESNHSFLDAMEASNVSLTTEF